MSTGPITACANLTAYNLAFTRGLRILKKGVCMQATHHEVRTNRGWTICLCLFAVIALATACAASQAQVLIGSSAAGWQTWTVTPISYNQPDLNDSGAPWWDIQWAAAGSYGNSTTADKNPGFCITATGDCVGMASGAFAPGALPFWATPYDSVNDSGGSRDNTVYFRSTGGALVATLFLNATANPNEVNDFGWFETNAAGTLSGPKHKLFSGTGVTKDQIPTPTGTAVAFTPTRYFGFYYSDVSEPACPDGTDPYLTDVQCGNPSLPLHGCYAYSLFNLNDPKCVESTGGQGDHDFVVFSANARFTSHPTFWIVGEDPADCATNDGDCNQTIVRVSPAPHN
jgi:hypothetical protein